MSDDNSLKPRLAVERMNKRNRPDETQPVLVIQINGRSMCTVVALPNEADAATVRDILADVYERLDADEGPMIHPPQERQNLGGLIERDSVTQ